MRLLLLACIALLTSVVDAQQDSLLGVLKNLPNDTSRLPVLTALLRNTVFSKPDSGLLFAAQYCVLAEESKLSMEIGKGHNYTGMCYTVKGSHDRALEHYLLALEQFRNGDDPWYTAMAHNNVASVLEKENRLEEALLEYREALEGFSQINDSGWIANVTNNLANVYYARHAWDSSAYYYEQADRILTSLQQNGFVSQVRMNLANTYYDKGDLKSALNMMRSALAIQPKDEDVLNLASILIGLGRMQGFSGILDSALMNIRHGLRIAAENGAENVVSSGEGALSEYFERIGRMDSALVHYKKSIVIRDSLFNKERSAQIAEMREKYESGQKDVLIAENQAKLDRRAITIRAIAVGATLLLLAGLFAYRAYRIKKRTSDELEQKNKTIDAQLKEKELLLREIHHRVKNNLQTVSSLLSLQSRSITDEKAREAVQDGRLRVKSMALIHQDLYREGDLTGVQMKEYVEKLATSLIASYDLVDRISLISEVQDISLDVDTAVPVGLILNELITNALKYAWPVGSAGELVVNLRETEGALHLELRDNGIGYDADATRSPESTGFGLGMVKSFATKLRAEWSIRKEGGTVVTMIIKNFKLAH